MTTSDADRRQLLQHRPRRPHRARRRRADARAELRSGGAPRRRVRHTARRWRAARLHRPRRGRRAARSSRGAMRRRGRQPDPRFPASLPPSSRDCDIEVSMLGPLEPVVEPRGDRDRRPRPRRRDGLAPRPAAAAGGTEWRWDRGNVRRRRRVGRPGWPRDAWQNGAKIWRFEAEVFGEGQEDLKSES